MAEKDSVLITSGEGIVQSIVPAADAGEGVEVYQGVLSPGFINCHCHLELSHMKGVIPERTGLVDFLSLVIRNRAEAHPVDPGDQKDRITEAILAGEQEMLDGGIVAVGDICNTADTVAVKRAGRLHYHNFVETMGFVDAGAPARFAHSKGVFEQFREVFPGSNSIVPHAPYSVSAALFRLVAAFPGKPSGAKVSIEEEQGTMLRRRSLLTIHNQESEAENEFVVSGTGDFLRLYEALHLDISFFKGTGKRSLGSFLPYFHRNQTMILVHNVATGVDDLGGDGVGTAAGDRPDLFFCLCPNANLYIGGLLPDVEMLVNRGCRIVIGTDSLASNHQLSILEELKTLQRAFPGLATPGLLQWATATGAEALHLEGMLGTFDAGKQPGVVLIEGMEGDRLTAGASVRRLL